MKKVVAIVVLGCAVLAASASANAEQTREVEPRWGIRPEKGTAPPPLDFARWLARRLAEGMAFPAPLPAPPGPKSAPMIDPGSSDGEIICPPDRAHCPMG